MKNMIIALALFLTVAVASVPAFAGDNDGKLNLNTATVEELVAVEGIDQPMAEGIIELRNENEEFVDMDELLDVDGMTPALLRKLSKFLYLEAASSCNC
ncbi:helix-hairpin-helix domain-containing protein [Pseudodesulfovibrio sp. JC047]|uniref:ComEA family DNA-binding protein n=1 Tax=Pseudodesulfovibrio sp. JC047 TaxID=2683199 RepID=UPI0013D63431|nr:helix-hairpin-helix domain-containing protein [Pseudodesulfovibrio sp. JC047]NDV19843.1 helix-hairpin-helix domain-containing protein [Pseudodesulfovibrio sp. JC047]